VFPTQIEELILKEKELVPHYQIEITRPKNLDEMVVLVERSPEIGSAEGDKAGGRLAHMVKSMIGVSTDVRVVQPGTIERSMGKARRVVDKRPK
jgi:phenylacetate-CoA ligase